MFAAALSPTRIPRTVVDHCSLHTPPTLTYFSRMQPAFALRAAAASALRAAPRHQPRRPPAPPQAGRRGLSELLTLRKGGDGKKGG